MKLTRYSIKFSTTVYVLIAILIIIGLDALKVIPVEFFPDVKQPVIMVSTLYPGVSPEDMESLITDKIEKKLKELQHVKELTSTSSESISIIAITFEPTVDVDWALSKVKDKVDLAEPDLPSDAETPIIKELAIDEFPVLTVNISGEFSLKKLKDIGEHFQDEFEAIPGVLRADLTGGLEREIQVIIDPYKMASYKVSMNDVMGAINQANINIPGGVVKVGNLRYNIRVPGEIKDIRKFNNIIVKHMMGDIVYLRDVAKVVDSFKDKETISRFNGKESVSLSIVKRSGANIIDTLDSVKKVVKDQINSYPKGLEINFLFDKSEQIKSMIKELSNNLITGVILVIIVLFIFLGFINSIFVAIALPLSMLIGIIIFNFIGLSLNMITLFSLILALGMLVDNGIVVIENIFRNNTMGIPRQYAAYKGTKEVAWPIIASTATTVAAFLPLLFWDSIMGEVMKNLPVVLIATLSASLFIALVINPVLSASFMRVSRKDLERFKKAESFEDTIKSSRVMRGYKKALEFSLKHPIIIIGLIIGFFVVTVIIFKNNLKGVIFFPEGTPENGMIKIEAPVGTRLDKLLDDYVIPIEQKLKEYDDITAIVSDVGKSVDSNMFVKGGATPHNAIITMRFKKLGKYKKSPYKIIEELREYLKKYIGAKIRVDKQQDGPPTGKPIQLSISGDKFSVIKKHINIIKKKITEEVKGVVDLTDDFTAGMPELQITINREMAKRLHLTVAQISSEIRNAIYGGEVSKLRVQSDEYDITIKYPEINRDSLEDIKNMAIPVWVMNKYEVIQIKQMADFKMVKGFSSVKHDKHKRTITITGDVQGVTSDFAMKKIEKMLKTYKLPNGYKVKYSGEMKDQKESQEFLSKAFGIALLLIMMILITQFNSILIPFVIFFSIVLSLTGVFWSIIILDSYFVVIMTGIGVISLAGVVVNNAIVLIDYIQQLREKGVDKREAIVRAGIVRFRPVMLTAVTTVFGLVPMMFGFEIDFAKMHFSTTGQSGEWWASMANAIGYGLIFATILTLIVVPVTYSIMDTFGNFVRKTIFRRKDQPFIDEELEKYEHIK